MAKFLPDSAIYGTYKRLRRSSKRSTNNGVEPMAFWKFVYAVKGFGARRKAQRARADFYKKHGYYQQ